VRDVGRAISAPENDLIAGWYNQQRAIILTIQRQPGANVIETVDRVKAMLPVLQASIPPPSRSIPFPIGPKPSAPRSPTLQFTCCSRRVGGDGDLPVPAQFLGDHHPSRYRALSLIGTFAVLYELGYSLITSP